MKRHARIGPSPRHVVEKLVAMTDFTQSDCWVWTGGATREGYGRVKEQGHSRAAHRVAYELLVGPIPVGLDLDHLCRQPSCINPAHLEPVTHRENILRTGNAAKTHCVHGHEFTPENTIDERDGKRKCRACKRAKDRRGSRLARNQRAA